MVKQCAFCHVVAGLQDADKIYEDDICIVILDKFQMVPGQMLVVPKNHHYSMRSMSDAEIVGVMRVVDRLGATLIRIGDADGYNVIYNLGTCAGQVLMHISFTVVPRRGDDGVVMPNLYSRNFATEEAKKEFIEIISKKMQSSEDTDLDLEQQDDSTVGDE